MGQTRWEDARRLEAWAGETRVNLIRSIALVVFYANHLLYVYVYGKDQAAGGSFHAAVTAWSWPGPSASSSCTPA